MAPIAVGDVIPNDTLPYFDEEDKAWAKTYPENKDVLFFADGSAKYTRDLDIELDLLEKGLRTRFKRFTLRFNDHDSSKSDTPDEPFVLTLNYLSCIGVSGLDNNVEDERGLDQVHASTGGLMTSKEVVAELMSDGL
ncbi:hypothetical protein ACFXTH_002959 [Malus domestica]